MYKLIIILLLFLVVMYYALVALHIVGAVKLTKQKIEAKNLLIPFYYFIKN